MGECPICGRPGLAEENEHCPQCGADLECFALLDDLKEPGRWWRRGKGGASSPPGSRWFMVGAVLLVLMGLASTGVYLGLPVERFVDQFDGRFDRDGQATNPAGKKQVLGIEGGEFAGQIADLERRRIVAMERVRAALAKYRAGAPVEGP